MRLLFLCGPKRARAASATASILATSSSERLMLADSAIQAAWACKSLCTVDSEEASAWLVLPASDLNRSPLLSFAICAPRSGDTELITCCSFSGTQDLPTPSPATLHSTLNRCPAKSTRLTSFRNNVCSATPTTKGGCIVNPLTSSRFLRSLLWTISFPSSGGSNTTTE
jgi:hypothetical protein